MPRATELASPRAALVVAAAALLGAAASLVADGRSTAGARVRGATPPDAPTAPWPAALEAGPLVVALDGPDGAVARALAAVDPRLDHAVAALRWADAPVEAARALGVVTAPHLLLVGLVDGAPAVIDACEPVGAARPGRASALRALGRFAGAEGAGRLADLRARAAGSPGDAAAALDLVAALEAAGDLDGAAEALDAALARERSTVGPLHRMAGWRALLASGEGLTGEPRTTLRAALKREADRRVLLSGWGLVASLDADRLRRAGDDDARERARADLLEATRETYKRCPDRDLTAMLEVIVARYALPPADVDVMDRYFLRGRVNQLARLAPDSPWLEIGRGLVEER